jgi:hypothetical protein
MELVGLSVAIVAAFGAGVWFNPWPPPWNLHPDEGQQPFEPAPPRAGVAAKAVVAPEAPRVVDPRQPEPRAVEARANAIQRDAAEIEAECQAAAGGDWDKWERETAPYRAALKARIDVLKEVNKIPKIPTPFAEGQTEPLEGLQGFPLFELGPREHINYLYDPATLGAVRRDRLVVAANRWLRQQGIDLILVAVPKMTEVYVDHFVDPCPKDGIIAPHARQFLLELLKADVEVVDGLPLFRSVRDTDSEYLYNAADTHWAPRGQRVMAKEVADRIERYKFGARARYGLPIIQTAKAPYMVDDLTGRVGTSNPYSVLSPEQLKRARPAQATTEAEVRMLNGDKPPDDPTSPVLVIGNSYVLHFREQLIRELNLLTCNRDSKRQTTEAFGDFLREPELLAKCRVVVWVTNNQYFTRFTKMPEPVMKALAPAK